MSQNELFEAPIEFFNRHSGEVETESVYGEAFLRWAYGNPLGRLTVELAVKRLWFSRWYGWRMDKPASREKVAPFIQDYGVDVDDFLDPADSYGSFNEFFYRKLKLSARPIAAGEHVAVFPADGRHLAIENVSAADNFYIKGQRFDLAKFLGSQSLAAEFEGGSMLISRLCPVDYHRYHFPVGGQAGAARILDGSLRSVSPLALRRKLSILWENRRMITEVESAAFGKMVVMEVGATCVGGMHSTFEPNSQIEKGADKGYFSFGGSCVTTVYKKGAIRLDDDLLAQAAAGREVYAKMGEQCGVVV
ncbi:MULTISPECIES: archaetidylserine decarboxylase [unclassified Lentimonas]|uniref:archaetidylserine decarboxylase n=1 Tax=unclassified Lentimonas TaxID=2630993 RepID=UPI00132215CA|nr:MULTISPECIES: archaetidylserine decarboxylase [unclassified Lentimonas]CAA6696801.1 Phosphatidylserine decarboxylase (EC [Lentimonas sp. CC19]CAA6697405.1 Phosphatidylserine decarboxylase (EC [Lentimonas sp. CC10]CAA7071336.1 Phosphatidylserine decarboxylase (EC [Lentimonas sp. CC11]